MARTTSMAAGRRRWTDSPHNLALFRIIACSVVLLFADVDLAARLSRLPSSLQVIHSSAAFPLAWLPIHPAAVRLATITLLLGCALGLVGWLTRPALLLAALSAVYVLGVTQHYGAVAHHHHMLWFLALLAVSPCADVLSVDAIGRACAGQPRPPPRALRYGIPIWGARLLIGLIFLFPGLWKLIESGWLWIASDNLQNQIYWKWYQHGAISSWRLDRYPRLCQALAFAVVAFELTFILALWTRSTRRLWALGAVMFHLATDAVMFIRFTSLWPCYAVLVDARQLLRELAAEAFPNKLTVFAPSPTINALRSTDVLGRIIYKTADSVEIEWLPLTLRHPLALPTLTLTALFMKWRAVRPGNTTERATDSPVRERPGLAAHGREPLPRLGLTLLALLVAGQLISGITGTMRGWPFACYPTFQWRAGREIPHLSVELHTASGSARTLNFRPQTQKQWGIQWSVIGATHGPVDVERLRAYWSTLRMPDGTPIDTQGIHRVRFYRAYSSVVPEHDGLAPVRRIILAELSL